MTEKFNRAMLEVARTARGFTQGELAARAGVTQALISKIENGITVDPTDDTVAALARALNVPTSLLFSAERPHGLPPFHYRKRAKLGKRALEKIEGDINLRRLHIARLLKSFEGRCDHEMPIIDLDRLQWTPSQAAQHVRGLWLMPRGPVDDLTEVVERAGGYVIQVNFDTNLLDALSFRLPGMPPLIFMNSGMPGERYRHTLAHELAHVILHNQPETDENMEAQADEFASELLMPAKEIKPYLIGPSLGKLGRVKPYWKVSIKSLIVRCFRLKVITPSQYTGLNVNYSKAGYSRGEPFPVALEKPSLISRAIRFHLNDLRYSVEEISQLLLMTPDDFTAIYAERPRSPQLRLVT